MIPQKMFRAGEVDVQNWKRSDIESYLQAAQSLLNMEVGVTGLTKKRKATQWKLDVSAQSSISSKMYEFRDQYGVYYIVLATGNTFYIYRYFLGVVLLIQTITGTQYTGNDIPPLDYAFNNGVLVFSGGETGTLPPSRIYVSAYGANDPITGFPAPTFTWEILPIAPLPTKDFGLVNYGNATVVSSQAGTTLTFTLTGLPAAPVFTTDWIGGLIIGGGTTDLQPIGLAQILTVTASPGTAQFTARILIPFLLTTAGAPTTGSQYSIQQPAWSTALGWPKKCVFYQNRLWFANTLALPATVFGSQINAFLSFDVAVGSDSDAIVYDLGNGEAGEIHWLNAGKQLEIYTHNFEYAAPQELNAALTPSTFSVRQQSSYGASNEIKPVTYINDSYFVVRGGSIIINFHFDGIGQTYSASNVGFQSSHLIQNPGKAAVLRGTLSEQDNFIYFLNTLSFQIAAFQFETEYKLAALTPFELEQEITINQDTEPTEQFVQVLDIVSIDNNIFLLKEYLVNGAFTLEVMSPNLSQNPVMVVKMDAGVNVHVADAGVIGGIAALQVNGLDGTDTTRPNLEGYVVAIVINNQSFGFSLQPTGVGGAMKIAPVTGGTAYFANSNPGQEPIPPDTFIEGIVGILFQNEVTPMYTFAGANKSADFKNITSIFVDYYLSIDFQVNGIGVPFQSFIQIQSGGNIINSLTGLAIARPVLGWNRENTFSITQFSPFDLNITGIQYQVEDSII